MQSGSWFGFEVLTKEATLVVVVHLVWSVAKMSGCFKIDIEASMVRKEPVVEWFINDVDDLI